MADVEDMADFTLTYDGPALQTGRMPVGDLAPALFALGELFHQTNRLMDPSAPPVRVEVKAAPRRGSFEIGLHVASVPGVDLFASPEAVAVANLIGYIAGASGIFALVKKIRNRRIVKREATSGSETTVTLEDGTTIAAPSFVVNAHDNATVRTYVKQVVAPINREGVDLVKVKATNDQPVEVRKDEADAFETTQEFEPTERVLEKVKVKVISPAFNPKYKWRIEMGELVLMAKIEADDFLSRVQRHEVAFLEGDALTCDLRLRQWPPEAEKPDEWAIVKVHSHEHLGGLAVQLPFSDQPPEESGGEE